MTPSQRPRIHNSIKSIRDGALRLAEGNAERFPAGDHRYPEHTREAIAAKLAEIDATVWGLVDALDEATYNVLDPGWDEATAERH